MMFFTGFADEASPDFARQIEATKKLGWKFIESRAIGNKNLASLSEPEFEQVQSLLDDSGVAVNCFGSGIANWSRDPRSDDDFEAGKKELLDAVPRMKKLHIGLVRGMSFRIARDEEPDNPEIESVIFRKVRELVKICEDNGILYGHENCMNYGGLSFQHTLKLIDAVHSPAFTLIFDTGNPVFNFRHIGAPPYPLQSSWEFYRQVREFISYVHIKDACAEILPDGSVKTSYTFAGDGCGDVRAIVRDLIRTGYDGGFSMEPHLATVFHDKGDEADSGNRRFDTYIEYGRRFEKLYNECLKD